MLLPLLLSLAMASAEAAHVRAPALPSPPLGPGPGAPPHAPVAPELSGLKLAELVVAEANVEAEVRRGGFPGAALAIGRWEHTAVERGIGAIDWGVGATEVDPDATVYDLASLTKVVATTTAVMLLVEEGRLELDAPVRRYLPDFAGGARDAVTIRQLLTHTSGLPAGANIWAPTPEQAMGRAVRVPLVAAPGARVEYSDIGFVVLWAAAESAAGEPLHLLLHRRVFAPLQMTSTTFQPGERCDRCAPTQLRRDGTYYRGVVHDPIARQLGGVAGNAGLFSTVHDLARFAAMLARGGELDGVRVLQAETVRRFSQRQPGAGTRALGWDTPNPRGGGAAGLKISSSAFGHTGFTGTSLWIDPERGTWTVLLANRTFQPKASNRIQSLRRQVHDWVATAADDADTDD